MNEILMTALTTALEALAAAQEGRRSRLPAAINGEPAEFAHAIRLLKGTEKVWLESEVLSASQPVDKRPAYLLHVELGRLGYKSHYELASQALERPVSSLATLTDQELAVRLRPAQPAHGDGGRMSLSLGLSTASLVTATLDVTHVNGRIVL
ncbi:hypothetical protein [Deinococcus sp. QL22]|uniref:hypothetical protein n=1 Tax=Deinococcus sp. QL22 TaxID=2939437 RepID=UPI0020176859|nr:hypothetical protein [Deinococcus sp. QL22]UQN09195.1 hypothetical protein M1R55_24485 [Deinococcus sp. QL22]